MKQVQKQQSSGHQDIFSMWARRESNERIMKSLKFNVFGRRVLVVSSEDGWQAFYLGTEGKRRPAIDIVVP
jgi:hypothetical protein